MGMALVTGAGGFLGQHVCALLQEELDVVGADLPGVAPSCDIEWHTVEQGDGLSQLVRDVQPDVVFHTAFVNRKPPDLTNAEYLGGIVAENCVLFETLTHLGARLVLVSSSAVYGEAKGCELIEETCPLQPVSVYGLAKVLQEQLAQFYSAVGLKVVTARLFNLVGPGQNPGMLLPDWVRQVAAVAKGNGSVLKVRHRLTSRDFVDVRDAARALILLAENCRCDGVFNVASGKAVTLKEVSDELVRICPVPLTVVETEPNPASSDVLLQRGTFRKLASACNWQPAIDWRRSLRDLSDEYGL